MENKNFLGLWYVRVLLVFIFIGCIVALVAYSHATWQDARYGAIGPMIIDVKGEGEVLARPDIGQFSFSVRAEGKDAVAAQDKSAEAINEILSYVKEAGVEEKDVKTQNYNLNPKYRYEERTCLGSGYCPLGDRVIDGYEVSQTVLIKVRDLNSAGNLISGVGERGATNISSLQFAIDDEEVLEEEARALAIVDAKEKAEQLAKDLDVQLVRMIGYYESGGEDYRELSYALDDSFGARAESSKSPSIPTGENSIVRTVSLTYEIK